MDIKISLQTEKKDLMALVDEKKSALKNIGTAAPDDADSATQDEERDQLYREMNNLSSRIRAIDTAVQRIDSGDFGWCDDCGVDIPAARLKSKPDAIRCVECQHIHEVTNMHYRGAA
jgi:DnaK suppressor protein